MNCKGRLQAPHAPHVDYGSGHMDGGVVPVHRLWMGKPLRAEYKTLGAVELGPSIWAVPSNCVGSAPSPMSLLGHVQGHILGCQSPWKHVAYIKCVNINVHCQTGGSRYLMQLSPTPGQRGWGRGLDPRNASLHMPKAYWHTPCILHLLFLFYFSQEFLTTALDVDCAVSFFFPLLCE